MEKTLTVGKTYTVTTSSECSVTDSNGLVLCTATAGEQKAFVATTPTITFSDDSASVVAVFKSAPALGSSGGSGVSITFDETPTADSTNAVTSGGIYTALLHRGSTSDALKLGEGSSAWHGSVAVGKNAAAWQFRGTAIGFGARANGSYGSVAVGAETQANATFATAIGHLANAAADRAAAFGNKVKAADVGVAVIGAWNNDGTNQTLLYLIGAGSTLATTYEDGEACMGYVVKDTSGNVSACGTQKLSALFPNNTAWATMALGLDDETPTPFLPTGATDPIEFPETEDLTEE